MTSARFPSDAVPTPRESLPRSRTGGYRAVMVAAFSLVVVIALALASLGWYELSLKYRHLARENDAMEWLQVGLLGVASMVMMVHMLGARQMAHRFAAGALMLLNLSLLLRELEFRKMPVALWVQWIDSASGHLTVLMWGVFACLAALRWRIALEEAGRRLFTPAAGLVGAAIALYGFGWPVDRFHLSYADLKPILIEEMLECDGCMLLLLAAILWGTPSDQRVDAPPTTA